MFHQKELSEEFLAEAYLDLDSFFSLLNSKVSDLLDSAFLLLGEVKVMSLKEIE